MSPLMPVATRFRHRAEPRVVAAALAVLLALGVVPPARAISKAAAEIERTFVLLPSSQNCAQTIQHQQILSYRRINARDPNGTYDGLVWRNLKVNGRACASVYTDLHSTFFTEVQTAPALGTASSSPWFLIGEDNAPRRCEAYSTNLKARYYFTRELDRFRSRLERDGLLLPGVATNAKRGMLFMFVEPFGSHSFLRGAPCVYADERDAPELISTVQGADNGAEAEQSSEANAAGAGGADDDEDDAPACFGGEVPVEMADGSVRLMKHVRVGDQVAGVHSAQRVVAFSHADARQHASFIQLQVRVSFANASTAAVTVVESVQVTRDHVVLEAGGRAMAAAEVRVGTRLSAVRGEAQVVAVRRVHDVGVWAPVTTEGALLVRGGVVVSCYSRLFEQRVAHALLAPVRAFWTRAGDWGLAATDVGRAAVLWTRASSR